MPYCNQCGRYIGGGMFCNRCGDARENITDENCRGMDGMPTPDGAPEEGACNEEMPSDVGETPTNDEETMTPYEGQDVCGDTNREVVSEGRTIVTEEEDEHNEETKNAEETTTKPKRSLGALFRRLGGYLMTVLCREEEIPCAPYEGKQGRTMAVLCYLGVLWAIPYFTARTSRYVAHHLERGLNMLLLGCLGMTLGAGALLLGGVIPILMPLAAALAELVLLVAFAGSAWNIVRLFAAGRGLSRVKENES